MDTIRTITKRVDSETGLDPNDPLTILVGNEFVKYAKPYYTTLIVTCIWSAMLVPLFVVLIFFSNHELRRKPVFIANVFAISIGVAFAGVLLSPTVSILRNPLAPPNVPVFMTTIVAFFALGPILVESVLLVRLWAVYPFKSTPRKVFFAVYTPIALIKIGRVTNAIIYVVGLSKRMKDGEDVFVLLERTWATFPNFKVGWVLQVVDITAVSALFLVKLNRGRALRTVAGAQLASTLDSLFWIAAYNFVIPVMLNIAELIVIWVTSDLIRIVPISIVNLYHDIIGVLFATVWAAGTRWQDANKSTGSGVQVLTTVEIGVMDMSPENSTERKR